VGAITKHIASKAVGSKLVRISPPEPKDTPYYRKCKSACQ
jgi:hypothetical protein